MIIKGASPLASWAFASIHELKVAGDSTNLQLQVAQDADYGIQICAIYNEQRKTPKFELIRVVPFTCTSCQVTRWFLLKNFHHVTSSC